MASEKVTCSIAGETVELLADRALYWPARGRLILADLHLGKGDVFRRQGISLPTGGTREDLARLSRLIVDTSATAVWILGDVVHGPIPEAGWRVTWEQWRADHSHMEVAAIIGNHDRALKRSGLTLDFLPDRLVDGPFCFQHEPVAMPSRHVICGHLHPTAALPGLRGRWPSFWLRESVSVLPAFSAFTGGYAVPPDTGARLGICARGLIVLVDRERQASS